MDEALEIIARKLVPRDWNLCDFEGGGFSRSGSSGLIYQLRLDILEKNYGLRLNPSLGVRDPMIGDLVSRFIGLPHAGSECSGLASVGMSLSGFLYEMRGSMDSVGQWSILRGEDVQEKVQALHVDVILAEDYFFNKFSERVSVVKYLERVWCDQFQVRQLAVGQALQGRRGDAISTLGKYADMVQGEPPMVADQARLFIRSFVEYFNIEEHGLEGV
ncbi:hypothetical protein HNR06_001019 [Nocardiopsis arvandica]|uniref:Uncharacterized protein n=1 Tax=Nocardiopsis sinuspersici TaxID=501010 RepID=A0A7Y9XAW1_9ACTN|nr:hypothetical protein [Nocardiopsis sinuspersici]NYH51430.1 hypothetical protein [Nocardiopsis sinuspersici]